MFGFRIHKPEETRGMSDSVHHDAELNNSGKRGKTRRQTGSSGAHDLESSSFTAAGV